MPARPSIQLEQVLYAAIFLLAVALRFSNLGGLPLTEHEAQAALTAHQLSQGLPAAAVTQPGYNLLALMLFFVAPSSEFLARLWPALFGSLFVLLPFFWRELLGRPAAVLLALALALDPGFVAVSRLASGRMLAVAGFALALTAWRLRKPVLAGAAAALALLSSSTLFLGALGALLLWVLFDAARLKLPAFDWRSAAWVCAGGLLLGATGFLWLPGGLSSLAAPLAAFLQGWAAQDGASILQIGFALLGYGFPALLLGIFGAVNAWRHGDSLAKLLGWAALLNLALVVIYPGRQVADLLWVLLPLWALAAIEFSRYLRVPQDEPRAAWGQAALILLLLTFLVLSLAKITLNEGVFEITRPYLFVVAGVVVLAALVTVLIGLGWSRAAATHGLMWALGLFFALALVSASTRAARNVAAESANELWSPGPAAGDLKLLAATLEDFSYYETGDPADVAVDLRADSAALAWATRRLPIAAEGEPAAFIITLAADPEPSEAASYRGQSFALSSAPAWDSWPAEWLNWLLYRRAPLVRQEAILWASSTLFPDGDTIAADGSLP